MISKKWMVAVLTGTLLLSNGIVFIKPSLATIEEDQARLDALKKKSKERADQISQLKNQESSLQQRIALMNQQVQETQAYIDSVEAEIRTGAEKIAELQREIAKTQDHLNEQKDILAKRVRVMYEDGDVSYLQVLMASTDFSDFLDRLDTLTIIVKQDKQLILTIKQMKQQLDDMQAKLQTEQSARLAKQQNLKEAKALLESQRNKQQQLLGNVKLTRAQQEAALKKEQEEENAIEASIAAQVAAQLAAQKNRVIRSAGSWLWPVPSSHTVSSGYGARWGGFHRGVDIAAPAGTPIVAVDNGVVLFAGSASGFGHWVVIQHSNGLMSVYGHMYSSGLLVSVGQEVKRGQIIARVGSDGESTGPHLHFSVAKGIDGSRMIYIDPSPYLGL